MEIAQTMSNTGYWVEIEDKTGYYVEPDKWAHDD